MSSNENQFPDIIIRSEEEAYNVLELASKDQLGPYGKIVFDGWPTLSLYFKGDKFEQSITPTVMKGLLEFQRGVYRSYATARFSNPSHRLNDKEKDDLEIKINVGPGSSKFDINYNEIALKLVEQLGARMNPTEVLISVVSIAVLYFGTSAYKSYLESRKEARIKEISDETQRQTLEVLKFTSQEETKRTAIIAELSKKDPRIEAIGHIANEAHTEVVKTMSAGTSATVAGISVSPEVSVSLTQNARRVSNEIRLDGVYKLIKLDWTDPLKFKVRVVNVATRQQIDAVVQDDSLTGRYKEALKAAEWSRSPVVLSINARQVGDEYKDAVIISAELLKVDPDTENNDE